MLKFLSNLFKKKPQSIESILLYPEGKRYYKDFHPIRKTQIDEDALKIIHRLNRFNHKAFLVGGSIRDLLMGKKPKDFDIATSATPNQIKNIFNNCRIIGKRFKIVHVIFKGKIIEVSTFRSLPEHRLQKIETSKDLLLKRDNNYGTAKEDSARRDFTINSLYFDTRNESIIDFVGGYEDIQNRILKVIGNPDVSFKEDPVRMLRAVKFQSMHALTMEKNTKIAIKKNRFELDKASSSRMLEEYNKIFRTWHASKVFNGFAQNFLFEVLFKEVIEVFKAIPNWQENFLETNIGKRLLIADRMLQEREELTSVIFFALIFADLVDISIAKEKNKNHLVSSIKSAIDPISDRLEIPKRDKERLIKIFASQSRFTQIDETNTVHNEVFRKKDFFYEAFMFFKINSINNKNEIAIQSAFFWEISTRNRPKQNQKTIHQDPIPNKEKFIRPEKKFKKKFRNEKSFEPKSEGEIVSEVKTENRPERKPDRKPEEGKPRFNKPRPNFENRTDKNLSKVENLEEKNAVDEKIPESAESNAVDKNSAEKKFNPNKRYRNRFRKFKKNNKKTENESASSDTVSPQSNSDSET